LASGLANEICQITTAGLAPAIFGPVMNTNGSMLANYWSKKLPKENAKQIE